MVSPIILSWYPCHCPEIRTTITTAAKPTTETTTSTTPRPCTAIITPMLCRTPGTCPTIASVYPSKLQRTTTRTLDVTTSLTLVSVQYFLCFLVPKHGTQKGQNIDKRNLLDEFVNWSFFSWLLIIYQQTLETSTSVPSPPATRFFALIICRIFFVLY